MLPIVGFRLGRDRSRRDDGIVPVDAGAFERRAGTRVARARRPGAQRILVILFYGSYVVYRPGKAAAVLAFLFEFALLDTCLSNQFMRWPILSPNYFSVIDRQTWR